MKWPVVLRHLTLLRTLFAFIVISGSGGIVHAESKSARGKAEHVVLVVWDGMRPEFITEANAPTLWKLAREGVTFRNHHSVYPTLTTVNVAALATGVYPDRSGPLGNYEYRPEIERTKNVRIDAPETIRKGDEITRGKFLSVPTIAELVQTNGGRSAIAGTKTAPLLFDRKAGASTKSSERSFTLFGGTTLPEALLAPLEKLLGPYPAKTEVPSAAQDKWTTRALTESFWKEGVPQLSVLWLADPDRSQHATGPGSETSLGGIKSSDANLGLLLQALEQKRVRAKTDILIVSDHGFSTIGRLVDVTGQLSKEGFALSRGESAPGKGEIRVAGNGGTNLFYVGEHDPAVTARLVEWLQRSDFAGVIFSRTGIEGTFPLSQVHLDLPEGPDVVLTFRWNAERNEDGVAGMIAANGTSDGAKGTHGTLSPYDVHNMLIAVGPDFRSGTTSDLPTSNLDVAPTILHLLGIKPPHRLDGRVMSEAFVDNETSRIAAETKTIEATRNRDGVKWRQYLRTSTVGDSVYIDEGNGGVPSE